jgi:Fe-S-cluster containining protein
MRTSSPAQRIVLYGQILHRFRMNVVQDQAQRQYGAIVAQTPWMANLGDKLSRVMNANASARSKLGQLERIADEIAAAISPHSGCKRGCSACCNISVALSEHEAQRLGERIGIRPTPPPPEQEQAALERLYFRSPCPFMHDRLCSIYEHRPIACRLHFSLDVDAYFCQTTLDPADSAVPSVDLSEFWFAYAYLGIQLGSSIGDIRQFFPAGTTPLATLSKGDP